MAVRPSLSCWRWVLLLEAEFRLITLCRRGTGANAGRFAGIRINQRGFVGDLRSFGEEVLPAPAQGSAGERVAIEGGT